MNFVKKSKCKKMTAIILAAVLLAAAVVLVFGMQPTEAAIIAGIEPNNNPDPWLNVLQEEFPTVAVPQPGATNVHYVDSWATFEAAWQNSNCSKIVLLNNISHPDATNNTGGITSSTASARALNRPQNSVSIEIDGRNPVTGEVHTLHVGPRNLRVIGIGSATAA
jgi:hypothetical protein